MKRVILFRGWNKKNKKWIYGYYCVNRGEHFIAPDEFVNPLASYEDYVVDADTVGQFTGIKDKKGKKIFEGDIIIEVDGFRHVIQYKKMRRSLWLYSKEFQTFIAALTNNGWINIKWLS